MWWNTVEQCTTTRSATHVGNTLDQGKPFFLKSQSSSSLNCHLVYIFEGTIRTVKPCEKAWQSYFDFFFHVSLLRTHVIVHAREGLVHATFAGNGGSRWAFSRLIPTMWERETTYQNEGSSNEWFLCLYLIIWFLGHMPKTTYQNEGSNEWFLCIYLIIWFWATCREYSAVLPVWVDKWFG